jgi:hypothetical protein
MAIFLQDSEMKEATSMSPLLIFQALILIYQRTASDFGVCISQLVRYTRPCSLDSSILQHYHLLSTRLLN